MGKFVLVGNKLDLLGEGKRREVDKELASDWARSQGMRHFEVSAKTGQGLRESAEALVRAVTKAKLREAETAPKAAQEEKKRSAKASLSSRLKYALKRADK